MAIVKITLTIDLGEDNPRKGEEDEKLWWENEVLVGSNLALHSNEVGDFVGTVKKTEKIVWIE